MPDFSERFGFVKMNNAIQVNSMSENLKNNLWNLVLNYNCREWYGNYECIENCYEDLFVDKYNIRSDELGGLGYLGNRFKEYFLETEWYEPYEIIEFLIRKKWISEGNLPNFIRECNEKLERFLSAYRLSNKGIFIRNTSNAELDSIDEAQSSSHKDDPYIIHLSESVKLLTNRESPSFRDSMKESISAVEALLQKITGEKSITLNKALTKLNLKGLHIHPSLMKSFEKLYAYTNDADGIRHALKGQDKVSYEDAMFMLVTCSAFINYLNAKVDSLKNNEQATKNDSF